MQRGTLGKSGSEAASQLQSRIARAFSSNSLVNTMEWISRLLFNIFVQKHNRKALRFTIKSLEWRYLGLLVYYSAKTSRHRQNGLSYVPKKLLVWMLRETTGGLKVTVDNKVNLFITLSA